MSRTSTHLVAFFVGTLLVLAAVAFQPSLAQAPAVTTVVLTGARVIDGTGRMPLEQATLLISNGRVQAVGTPAAVQIPAGATRVDVSGKTIVPGFINAHGHVEDGDEKLPLREQIIQQLRLYASYGVTTVYLLGDDGIESVRVRDEQEHGTLDRARLYVAGPKVVGNIESADSARQRVDKNAAMGVNIIKIQLNASPYTVTKDMTPEIYRAAIEQAHKHGLRVAAHLYYLKDAKALVDAGLDVMAHSVRDQDIDPAFIAVLKRRDVGYIPTLARDQAVFAYETTPGYFSDPFFLRGLPIYRKDMEEIKKPAVQQQVRNSEETKTIKKAFAQDLRNLKLLSDGGVAIAMGTESGSDLGRWQGYFEHRELELMVQAGMTPMQVLVAATGGAAHVMRLDQQLGTLQPGKWADFIVLNANPLTDIRNTRQIDSVWIAGRRLSDAPRSH